MKEFDIHEIFKAIGLIRDFNAVPLKDISFTNDGKTVEQPHKLLHKVQAEHGINNEEFLEIYFSNINGNFKKCPEQFHPETTNRNEYLKSIIEIYKHQPEGHLWDVMQVSDIPEVDVCNIITYCRGEFAVIPKDSEAYIEAVDELYVAGYLHNR